MNNDISTYTHKVDGENHVYRFDFPKKPGTYIFNDDGSLTYEKGDSCVINNVTAKETQDK